MPPWAWAGLGVLGIAGTVAGVWLLGRAFDEGTAPPSRIERKRGRPRLLSQEELEDYLTADADEEDVG